MNIFDDGFSHRWCVAIPSPPELSIDEILTSPEPQFPLSAIFLFIAALNEIPREFDFSVEAFEMIKIEYTIDRQNVRISNTFMYYFS